ncbi:sulfotransferase family protein [Candidatus Micrarchaeota archaeon]|nr:sulfotransferase family protein [Candidatus Micrarchaeota archaeon]
MRKYRKHLIIVGSARSGTSWLAELIARQFRYRLLFEPEHETNTPQGKLICDRYITAENTNKEIDAYFSKIFSNRVDSNWVAQSSNRKFKMHLWPFLPKKYIIKFVRCNLAAHYINRNFQLPLIHIVRNPYEVLHSQNRVKFDWLYDLSRFLQEEELVEIVQDNYGLDLSRYREFSELEKLCLRWCLENVIPLQLKEAYPFKSEVVRHEELKKDISVFYELCGKYDLEPQKDLQEKYGLPSSKTHPKSVVINKAGSKSVTFTAKEYRRINKILDIFEVSLYPRRG